MNDFSAYPNIGDNMGDGRSHDGLTRRELFAAMAMQGHLSNERGFWQDPALFAETCVLQADTLIAELDKEVVG
jgi:hypothetical protein